MLEPALLNFTFSLMSISLVANLINSKRCRQRTKKWKGKNVISIEMRDLLGSFNYWFTFFEKFIVRLLPSIINDDKLWCKTST